MYSQRFCFKARGHAEGLESRRDWKSTDGRNFLSTGQVVTPASQRGKEVELALRSSFNLVFATSKWMFGELHLHLAARPIHPYRDCVELHQPPRLRWNITIRENRPRAPNRPSIPGRAPLFPHKLIRAVVPNMIA